MKACTLSPLKTAAAVFLALYSTCGVAQPVDGAQRKQILDGLIEPKSQPRTTPLSDKERTNLDEAARKAGKTGLTKDDKTALDEASRLSNTRTQVPDLPAPTARIDVDPAKIAKQYADLQLGIEKGDGSETPQDVMVFVSLSMPKASLERIAAEAGRLGLPLYFRGVSKGLGANYNASIGAMDFVRRAGANLQIHPELFKQYDIKRVPAFVVAQNPQAGCSVDRCESAAAVVYGDVGIQFAMNVIGKRNDAVGDIARKTVSRIEGLPAQGRQQGNVRKRVAP